MVNRSVEGVPPSRLPPDSTAAKMATTAAVPAYRRRWMVGSLTAWCSPTTTVPAAAKKTAVSAGWSKPAR